MKYMMKTHKEKPIIIICSILLLRRFEEKPKNPNQAYPFKNSHINYLREVFGKLKAVSA